MNALIERTRQARTLLFTPGDRPERFAKASAAGQGLVVLDLEDAVVPERKPAARAHVLEWLDHTPECVVRINAAGTEWFDDDVHALAAHDCTVMVPKAEDPRVLSELVARLNPATCVIGLIETAAGVLRASQIAATPGVQRLAFGNFDLAAQLGVAAGDRLALTSARSDVVLASAAAGIPGPIDGVSGDVRDMEMLRADVIHARALGFTGKLCVHPRQLAVADELLRPSADELAWARSIVDAPLTNGVAVVGGQMVDKPVLNRAHQLLGQAEKGDEI